MSTRRTRRAAPRGFSLIELMVVISTIGVLSAIAIPRFTSAYKHSRAVEAYETMAVINRSLTEYLNRNGEYPSEAAPPNPPDTVTKGPMVAPETLPGWRLLSFTPESEYRWHYEVTPTKGADGHWTRVTIHAYADTDKDGYVGHFYKTYDTGFLVDESTIPD